MSNPFSSLRGLTSTLIICAFVIGGLVVWLWVQSNSNWRAHQTRSYLAGLTLYNALQNGTPLPKGVHIKALSPSDQSFASAGNYQQITGAPRGARITNVPISADTANIQTGAPFALVIASPDLVYRIAELSIFEGQSAAETTGGVFRLLASYCSDPLVIGQFGEAPWVRIDGSSIWGCSVAPYDLRLIAVLIAIISVAIMMTVSLNQSSAIDEFAEQLRNRRRVGGPTHYDVHGPQELENIVTAVNSYLETERAQLEGRAAVLSGVSHDLGTPATRLRLRTALIEDDELRHKLEADIDSMTGMIESVLTYTRTELNAEAPRKLSLNALIAAIVANYEDMGRAVSYNDASEQIVKGARSVFMSRQGQAVVTAERETTIMGRPISLERAISNLIDNALKYGRRAKVSLQADADTATIIVEDEGSESSAADVAALLAPFQRGHNTGTIAGHGLGLTIVATIANLHGGSLSFEDTANGVSARLSIQRNK